MVTKEHIEILKSEAGDCFWYLVMMLKELGLNPSDILQQNIDKLQSRKERNVIKGSGDNR